VKQIISLCLCTGHSSSALRRKIQKRREAGVLQTAEKLIPLATFESFVTGHHFSHADKVNRTTGTLAPADLVFGNPHRPNALFRSPFNPEATRANPIPDSGLLSL
jgi:hypothetical protein